jgi:hypothetical protein
MYFQCADLALALALCLLTWGGARAQTLNEIMFNPDGDENADEFIELVNTSVTTLDLSGWRVTDGVDTDSVVAWEQGLHAHPGQIVLILDPDYFEDSSTTYDGRVPESALVVTIDNSTFGSRGLLNSGPETVSLIDRSGHAVSSWAYSIDNVPGYSEEKILTGGGDVLANWSNSRVHHGTPGARNSVTPPDHDLAITRVWPVPLTPQIGETFELRIRVVNVGRFTMGDTLTVYERVSDAGEDSLNELGVWSVPLLAAADSAEFLQNSVMAAPVQSYLARLSGADDEGSNDAWTMAVSSGGSVGFVVINEILYAPEPQRSEWVELVNTTPFPWNLEGWSFADGTCLSDSTRRVILPDVTLAPQSFIVLAADSAIFFENVPPTIPVVVWNTAPISFNNSGDSLLLYDPAMNLMDRVDYRPSWSGGEENSSLERISTASASNDRLNWAPSLDSTGGTPGRLNSRTLAPTGETRDLMTLEPNPFSPDGDGRKDLLAIRYHLEQADSRLDLKIYDVRGREVRRLASSEAAGYAGEKLWDGRDDSGRALPRGMYIIYLEALGKGGTRMQSAKRVVAMARRS